MPKLGLGLGIQLAQNKIIPQQIIHPVPLIIWSFPTPLAGRTITGFSVSTTSGTIFIDWGDNTSNTINSDALVNKTY